MVEKEYKTLLSFEQFERIKALFHWDVDSTQTNYYYDTTDRYCFQKNITVRIRRKNEKYFLQVKIPISKKNGLNIKQEFQKELFELKEYISSYELFSLTSMKFPKLYRVGYLTTHRLEYYCEGTIVCLDINTYNNITDYELEVEFVDYADTSVMNIICDLGVSFDANSIGKFSRFCNSMNYGDEDNA